MFIIIIYLFLFCKRPLDVSQESSWPQVIKESSNVLTFVKNKS